MAQKILIVEDNDLNIKLFSDILEYQGYSIEKATTGTEGYQKIKSIDFDLIILDIQLPDFTGYDLIKKLEKDGVNLPKIIVVSACASDDDKAKAKKFNIEHYLTKPIDINNFINVVKQTIV